MPTCFMLITADAHPLPMQVKFICMYVDRALEDCPSVGEVYGGASHQNLVMASISWAWVQMVNSLLQFIIPASCPSGMFLPCGWKDLGNLVFRLF